MHSRMGLLTAKASLCQQVFIMIIIKFNQNPS